MDWCACCGTSGRCRGSSGGGAAGWSACASHPCIHSLHRSRKAFPPCFTGVSGWDICAKNWQLIEKLLDDARTTAVPFYYNPLLSIAHAAIQQTSTLGVDKDILAR